MSRKRYAIVGTGSRSNMFSHALFKNHQDDGELVALCDINPGRMAYWNKTFAESYEAKALPTYAPAQFESMIQQEKVDAVIVTTVDRLHHHYIIRAMEAGCDCISEKPMTTDAVKAREILDAIDRTGRKLTVTFNYRYAPRNSKIKELILDGAIGDVKSVHFEWMLNTDHGADYFRRWHRDKRNSGGLLVHKSTHHFDLVNWWLDTAPVTVSAMGGLVFYGRENAESRGVTNFYDRGTNNPLAKNDPFALRLDEHERLKGLYLECEEHDGYVRDRNVFTDGINIEDDTGVLVRYRSGATMSYHLNAYSPMEGYNISFNGTKGRLEYRVIEKHYISGGKGDTNQADNQSKPVYEPVTIQVQPLWEAPYKVEIEESGEGGHGGGDRRLLHDIFVGGTTDPLERAADHIDGVGSILTGIAANHSIATGQTVHIKDLLQL